MRPIDQQVRRITALRSAGPIVINARCDLFLRADGDAATRFERTCERLRAYIGAGADCVFVPGVSDESTIGRLVDALRFPLNVLAVPGTPPISRLKELGVARVSVGSGIARSAMGHTRRVAQELRKQGTYNAMLEGAIPFAEANSLFSQ